MTKVSTILGEVKILNAEIGRTSSYGQYKIYIDIEFEGENKSLSIHTTDSQLFDDAQGEDNSSEIILKQAGYRIEKGIEDYITSI